MVIGKTANTFGMRGGKQEVVGDGNGGVRHPRRTEM